MPNIFVGIDVSKDKFDVGIKDERNETVSTGKSYKVNRWGIKKFVANVDEISSGLKAKPVYGLEATGIYYLPIYEYLHQADANVFLLNPLEIKKKDRRMIRKTKTDKLDALFIAESLMLRYLDHHQYKHSGKIAELREYCRIRERLMNKSVKCKMQASRNLDVLCRGYDKHFTDVFSKSSVAVIKKAIRKTRLFDVSKEDIMGELTNRMTDDRREEKAEAIIKVFEESVFSEDDRDAYITELHMLIAQYDLLQAQVERVDRTIEKMVDGMDTRIRTIPGIGPVTCGIILSEIGDISRFENPQQLVAFAGLDPAIYESGRSKSEGRISKRGSPILREALYHAAFAGLHCNPVVQEHYNRLKSRGKHHKVCMVASARKLLHIVYSVWKNNREFYVPEKIEKKAETR